VGRATSVSDAGFTLVEMLVSLSLLALAAVLMVEGLGSSQRLWAGEAARTARGETIEAAQTTLRARLERLRPVTLFDGSIPYADIDGSDRQLLFIAPPADVERPSASRRYRLTLNGEGDLLLGAAPVDADAGDVYTEQVLLRDVGGLDISYYGADTTGAAPSWRTEWMRRVTPPALIRIRLALKSGDRRFWPDLIVHPVASVDTLCSIERTTGSCRGRE
jgi:general secretion pathway protein J